MYMRRVLHLISRDDSHAVTLAGITNYIDLGLQVATDVVDGPGGGNGTNGPERLGGSPGSAALGAAWQVQF